MNAVWVCVLHESSDLVQLVHPVQLLVPVVVDASVRGAAGA